MLTNKKTAFEWQFQYYLIQSPHIYYKRGLGNE